MLDLSSIPTMSMYTIQGSEPESAREKLGNFPPYSFLDILTSTR
jgi:hypothetical protein